MGYNGWTNAFNFTIGNSVNLQTLGYSDFTYDTFYQRLASKVPVSYRPDVVFIPTFMNQYGVLNFNADDGTYHDSQTLDNQYVEIEFHQADGTLISIDTTYQIKVEPGKVSFVPLHAASVNFHIGIPANTAFYLATLKDINDNKCSPTLLFYIEDQDCKHEAVNIAWIGKRGGCEPRERIS